MCSDCHTFEQTDDCYLNTQAIDTKNSCSFQRQTVNWTVVNSLEGLVDCEFCLGLNNYISYEIELRYVAGVNSAEQCTKNGVMKLHTGLTYKIGQKTSSLPQCQQTGKVQFKYVYTGCYVLKIIPQTGSGTRQAHIAAKFIQTDHVKRTYADNSPLVAWQYRPDDDAVILTITHQLLYNDPSMLLTLIPESEYLKIEGQRIYKMIPVSSRQKLVESCKIYDVTPDSETVECDMKYIEGKGIANCRIKNIGFGNYTAEIKFLGDPVRCRSSTVWGDDNICVWSTNIIPVTEPPVTASTTDDSSTLETQIGVSVLVVTIILLLIFSAFVYRNRKRILKFLNKTQLISTSNSESDELRSLNRQRVFLLYPRDCPAYMDFMVAFKNLLNKSGNYEVFDIHDESRDYEISQSPEEWVREKLLQVDEYKIILCSSPCAALQTTMSIRSNSVYRHSRYTDGLFPYAIRFLSQNVRLVSYTRLFVVHSSFDTESYKSLMFNPYTRYGLPEHCASLFADLSADEVSSCQMQDTIEYQLLLSSYRTLQEYLTLCPDYLRELLNVAG
ncbi:hypothetical protein CBL_10489 [Carabus blaptoides fortunei]